MKKKLLTPIALCLFALFANSQNLILNSDMSAGCTNWNGGTCTPEIGYFDCSGPIAYFEDSYGGPSTTNVISQVTPDNCMQQTISITPGTIYTISFDATRRTTCGYGGPGELVVNPGINVKITGVTSGTVYSSVDYHYNNQNWVGYTTETQIFSIPVSATDAQVKLDITAIDNPPVGCGIVMDNITMVASGVLPVSLTAFNAALKNSSVDLSWTTSNEINNSYFIVFRSKDGVNFTEIGRVNAAGISTGSTYTLNDANPGSGINYYRLRQVDRSGSYKVSGIVKVNLAASDMNVLVYPTIVSSTLNYVVETPKAVKLTIFVSDISGKRINNTVQNFTNGTTQKSVNVSTLSSGVYLLTVIDEATGYKKSVTFKKD